MNTIAIVQARLGSTRLPGKVLMDIGGKPMVQHVLERAKQIPGVDGVVLALAWDEQGQWWNVPSETFAGVCVLCCHGGGRKPIANGDVLGRYWSAARESDADVIVRLTADCPLVPVDLTECLVEMVRSGRRDYATQNTGEDRLPDGADAQVFTRDLLERAYREATDPSDREHVCPWMERNAERPFLASTPLGVSYPKLSVDTQADLDRVRRIMARIPAGDTSWRALKEALHAELPEIS